jgi:UDP-N-acetylmuramate--alanine ligase
MIHGKFRNIHFVGIGGIGMSGIAEVMLTMGYRVTGSDLKESRVTRRLIDLGADIHFGHHPGNLNNPDVVVVSSAVGDENVEVISARELKIPVIKRAEMLAELMRIKYGIAVAGAHGKTTTTSMIATVLTRSNLDPTVVIGGRLESLGSNARLGKGDVLVAEADESDGSFLRLNPAVAVVTNIDAEHLDHYKRIEAIEQAFLQFVNNVPFYGLSVVCLDDPYIQKLIPHFQKRFLTYGLSVQADIQARDIHLDGLSTHFRVHFREQELGEVTLQVPGIHNLMNSLAAIGVGLELELDFGLMAEALYGLSQIHRRFEIIGQINGMMVMDDYGHHPTEIKATLSAAKQAWSNRRHVVVFQPHRYSRVKLLYESFVTAFYQADVLIVNDIYPAGEKKIKGVDGRWLFEGIRDHGHKEVVYLPNRADTVAYLMETTNENDLVITLGAGDVWQVGRDLLEMKRNDGKPV